MLLCNLTRNYTFNNLSQSFTGWHSVIFEDNFPPSSPIVLLRAHDFQTKCYFLPKLMLSPILRNFKYQKNYKL